MRRPSPLDRPPGSRDRSEAEAEAEPELGSRHVTVRRLPALRSAIRTPIRVSQAPNAPSPRHEASERYAVTNASWAASSASAWSPRIRWQARMRDADSRSTRRRNASRSPARTAATMARSSATVADRSNDPGSKSMPGLRSFAGSSSTDASNRPATMMPWWRPVHARARSVAVLLVRSDQSSSWSPPLPGPLSSSSSSPP